MANDFGLLFGGGGSALDEYLTEDQKRQIQQQGMLQAAAALLQASGRSATPISLGQALGGALQAGTAGYQQAQQGALAQLMTRQKMDEARRAQAAQESYQKFIMGQPSEGQVITPEQAISTPGMAAGPTVERAAMIGQPTTPMAGGGLTRQQRALLAALPAEKGIPEALKLMQPPEITGQAFKGADGNYYYMTKQGPIPASIAPADLAAEEFGAPQPQVVDGQIRMVQYNKKGESRVVSGVMPYEPQSQDIRAVEYIQGRPLAGTGEAGIGAVGQYRQQIAPKTSVTVPVDMTGGQKGFENEMSLGKSFRSEPIYKDFNDMKSAFSQVVSSFKQGTPIGDVAGATKIMKLLDPGSVVRESELAIAMQAGGRLDRLQNYFNMWASGEKLTPTQRDDFQALANELYAAAGQAYNQKRAEYENFGRSYGFKNLDTALGGQATLPSVVRKPPAGAAPPAAATPPSIQDILNKYPPRK